MIKPLALAAALLAAPVLAQDAAPQGAPSPTEIVAQAAPAEWVRIAPENLLVMTLAPSDSGKERRVVIQLMPPPFSQPWVANIRSLAKAHWWDGLAIVRVQDNYVVQWGDPDGEDPAKARPLPTELSATSEADYVSERRRGETMWLKTARESYAPHHGYFQGWPIAWNADNAWPVHCYGMVGVGRNYSPDAGTGAELYTVIGHAPRQLDRNIALVGRVIEGIENLSSLPRGTGPLG
ncbi:MAG: peptidylprolyl isomerase, partial [Tsuneonella sp.]